jgi:hypothetical protein
MRKRITELVKLALGPGVIDVRGITVKEAGIGLGWGFLLVGLGLLELFLGVWQIIVGLLLFGYDLLTKGLSRIMPKDLVENGKG